MDTAAVVDPIRIPDPIRRGIEATPLLGRVFIALAALDVVARALGFLSPAIDLDLSRPLFIVSSFLPRELLIVLPAIVVIRVRGAARLTPWVLAGTIAVSLVELLFRPIEVITSGFTIGAWIAAVHGLGWFAVGWGLGRLNPKAPPPQVAGTANLVAAILVLATGASLFLPMLVQQTIGLGAGPDAEPVAWVGLLEIVGSIGWAYLVRAVIRGFGDPRRPSRALAAGALGALVSAIFGLAVAIVEIDGSIDPFAVQTFSQSWIGLAVVWLAIIGGPVLIAVALALGLADPFSRVGGMRLD